MPEKERTKGGIILPDSVQTQMQQATTLGTVVDIAPMAWHDSGGAEAWKCKVGSVVSFNKYCYRDVNFELDEDGRPVDDGNLFKMINDKDVIGVYNND